MNRSMGNLPETHFYRRPWKDQAPTAVDDSAASQFVKRQLERLGPIVSRHPVAALGIGIAVGLALGWWVKRR
jgi:hypothetical protein